MEGLPNMVKVKSFVTDRPPEVWNPGIKTEIVMSR
jgi:hypothetical protein